MYLLNNVDHEHKSGEVCVRHSTINSKDFKSLFCVKLWEKDEYHLSLTNLSLEEIMQSKEYELLKLLI